MMSPSASVTATSSASFPPAGYHSDFGYVQGNSYPPSSGHHPQHQHHHRQHPFLTASHSHPLPSFSPPSSSMGSSPSFTSSSSSSMAAFSFHVWLQRPEQQHLVRELLDLLQLIREEFFPLQPVPLRGGKGSFIHWLSVMHVRWKAGLWAFLLLQCLHWAPLRDQLSKLRYALFASYDHSSPPTGAVAINGSGGEDAIAHSAATVTATETATATATATAPPELYPFPDLDPPSPMSAMGSDLSSSSPPSSPSGGGSAWMDFNP
jgi:hypothetical protein